MKPIDKGNEQETMLPATVKAAVSAEGSVGMPAKDGTDVTRSAIRDWDRDDQPREKLLDRGAGALTNAELLAILIGSGSVNESAVELMRRVMHDCGNSLRRLSQLTIADLMQYKGIGMAKAVTLMAASELGRRRREEQHKDKLSLSSSEEIYEFMLPKMQDLLTETAWILLMSNSYQLIGNPICISNGGMTETAVDVRVIARHALMHNASVVVLLHNHPSNNLRPSRDDDRITAQVADGLKLLRMYLVDHIIVADTGYYSYRDQGKL